MRLTLLWTARHAGEILGVWRLVAPGGSGEPSIPEPLQVTDVYVHLEGSSSAERMGQVLKAHGAQQAAEAQVGYSSRVLPPI